MTLHNAMTAHTFAELCIRRAHKGLVCRKEETLWKLRFILQGDGVHEVLGVLEAFLANTQLSIVYRPPPLSSTMETLPDLLCHAMNSEQWWPGALRWVALLSVHGRFARVSEGWRQSASHAHLHPGGPGRAGQGVCPAVCSARACAVYRVAGCTGCAGCARRGPISCVHTHSGRPAPPRTACFRTAACPRPFGPLA